MELLPQGTDYSKLSADEAKSLENRSPAHLVTCGADMLRKLAHAYARRLVQDGIDVTYGPYPLLLQAFIQATMQFKACLQDTKEVASLLGRNFIKGR